MRLRLTGPVALNDEQFATLQQGAVESTVLSIVLVCAILFAAVRSVKLVGAILVTLCAGLVLTAGFAALAIGSLNLISVAFGVLFIGLAVDFGIQFSVRYRDQRHRLGTLAGGAARAPHDDRAVDRCWPARATAIGFLAFVPTSYTGIRELGWIAGFGMLVAVVLNFVLLPALLTLLRPRGEPEPVGFRWAAPLDRLLLRAPPLGHGRRRRAGGGLPRAAAADQVRFRPAEPEGPESRIGDDRARPDGRPDDDALYGRDPRAVACARPKRSPTRLAKLPEVAQAITAASFIPADQEQKLAILADLALLLGPTLSPDATLPPPTDDEIADVDDRPARTRCSRSRCEAPTAGRIARRRVWRDALDGAAARGPAIMPALQRGSADAGSNSASTCCARVIDAKPVTLDDLPPELRDSWITPDGRARVEVFPKDDARDHEALKRFVAAMRTVAPDAYRHAGDDPGSRAADQLGLSAGRGDRRRSRSSCCSRSCCGGCAMSRWSSRRCCSPRC